VLCGVFFGFCCVCVFCGVFLFCCVLGGGGVSVFVFVFGLYWSVFLLFSVEIGREGEGGCVVFTMMHQ